MSNDSLVTLLRFIAGGATTFSWIPQAVRSIRSRSTRDISWAYLATFTFGIVCWGFYGYLRSDAAVLAANVVTLLFLMPVIAVKLRER